MMKVHDLGPETNIPWLRQMRVLDNHAWSIFMNQYVPNLKRLAIQSGVKPDDADEIVSRVTTKLCHEFARKINEDYLPFRSYLADCLRVEIQRYRYETRRFLGRNAWYIVKDWWCLWSHGKLPKELEEFVILTTLDVSPKAEYIRELYKYIKERVDMITFESYYHIVIKGESYSDLAAELNVTEAALRMRIMRVRQKIVQFNNSKSGKLLVSRIQGEPIFIDQLPQYFQGQNPAF